MSVPTTGDPALVTSFPSILAPLSRASVTRDGMARSRMMRRMVANLDRRTVLIFGGYAVAFVLVALANLLGLPPLVRFGAAVIGLAAGAVAVGEATERL